MLNTIELFFAFMLALLCAAGLGATIGILVDVFRLAVKAKQ